MIPNNNAPKGKLQQIVDSGDWEWMVGMVLQDGSCLTRVEEAWTIDPPLPDLSSPATRGCVLYLIQKLWEIEGLHLRPRYDRSEGHPVLVWKWQDARGYPAFGETYDNEEEALIDALLLFSTWKPAPSVVYPGGIWIKGSFAYTGDPDKEPPFRVGTVINGVVSYDAVTLPEP